MKQRRSKKYGMVIDLDRCTGCGACMVACMAENNVPFKTDESNKLDSITWMRIYRLTNGKPFPDMEVCFLPRPCMQCEGEQGLSPCVSVCPSVATDYDFFTGIVSQVPTRCIGCRYCMAACPYHARYFNWHDPVWPQGMKEFLSPSVSPRMRGVVEKCTFCFHRYQQAMDKAYAEKREALEEDEYQPACVQACPAGAMVFGDLNDGHHAVTLMVEPDPAHGGKPGNPEVFRLLERLGTNPKVYYRTEKRWVRQQSDNQVFNQTPPWGEYPSIA